MCNIETICSFSADDIIILNELIPLAKEAKKAVELIRKNYCFGIGVDNIEIWSDGCNFEYLTHDGVWQARYLHQTYDIQCTEEEIFKLFRAEYLVNNGFVKEYENNERTEEGKNKIICGYFRSFLRRAKECFGED